MYCPRCQKNVDGKRVWDDSTLVSGCLWGLAAFLVLSILGSPTAGIGVIPFVLIWAIWTGYFNAPRECPYCRTRLVNILSGDVSAVYKNSLQAKQSSHPGYCHGCDTKNADDARYCLRCGAELARPPGYCHSCDTQNCDKAEYCSSCGAKIIPDARKLKT